MQSRLTFGFVLLCVLVSAVSSARIGYVEVLTLVLLSLNVVLPADIGFCMDNIPAAMKGTGFAAASTTDEVTCKGVDPLLWCNLRNETGTWTPEGGSEITFYFFSGCCSGWQGQRLIYDPGGSGFPSCEATTKASECTRTDWHTKFMNDFIDHDISGYDFKVTPSTLIPNSTLYGGTADARACSCEATDPGCQRQSKDGTICLICVTDEPCSSDVVEFNLNFFKIHTVNLKTSELSFSIWVREIWYDHRLDYDYQCYGGLEYFEVFANAGDLENTQIWTPDIALYNGQEDIWQGSIAPRQASVWSCWDGTPSRGGCGYIYWARPGILHALCKYSGLVRFPYDDLSCELEFAPWSVDGRFQDVKPREKDGGIEFACEGCEAVTGLTAGTKFQDYVIDEITAKRVVVRYPSSPTALWPELVYTVRFGRSQSFYEIQLVMPGCLLTFLSFLVFWMNPKVTDRLGYGCTVMLAMMTNQIVSTAYMPVCEERVMMDYMGVAFVLFGAISMIESALVLYISSLQVDDLAEAFIPYMIRRIFSGKISCSETHAKRPKKKQKKKPDYQNKDYQLRRQLYHQIYYALDRDFSGSLELEEIEEFGIFIKGSKWSIDESQEFLKQNDDSFDGALNFEEFSFFCEDNLLLDYRDDLSTLTSMIKGFLVVINKKLEARDLMWKLRALQLDQFCRWAIPPGFIFFLMLCWLIPYDDLEGMSTDRGRHAALILSGLYPIMFILLTYGIFTIFRSKLLPAAKSHQLKLFRSKGSSEEDPENNLSVSDAANAPHRTARADELVYMGANSEAFSRDQQDRLKLRYTSDDGHDQRSPDQLYEEFPTGGRQNFAPAVRNQTAARPRLPPPRLDRYGDNPPPLRGVYLSSQPVSNGFQASASQGYQPPAPRIRPKVGRPMLAPSATSPNLGGVPRMGGAISMPPPRRNFAQF